MTVEIAWYKPVVRCVTLVILVGIERIPRVAPRERAPRPLLWQLKLHPLVCLVGSFWLVVMLSNVLIPRGVGLHPVLAYLNGGIAGGLMNRCALIANCWKTEMQFF
ncbi:uncharacterized protein G2W53_001568 [Senna tora]|uniref:Uncharacterized protein n=1 Tax=Senna tora TaxID=362788 RepID=A0A834XJY4_9FABA|nr:uncharacterized protein G2W53_001568 [Senna tora]